MEADPQATAGTARSAAAAKDSPFQEEHYLIMQQATARHKVIKRMAWISLLSAASILVMAALSLPLLVFDFGGWSLLVVVTLWTVGLVEYRGHKRLRLADPTSSCRMLGFNQLAFLTVIIIYCLGQLLSPPQLSQNSEEMKQLMALDRGMAMQMSHLTTTLTYSVYSAVIVLSIVFQGGLALYYFNRRKTIEAYVRDTPDWARRMITETGA